MSPTEARALGERLGRLSYEADFCAWLRRRNHIPPSIDMHGYIYGMYIQRGIQHGIALMEEYDRAH